MSLERLRETLARLRGAVGGGRADADLRDELESHQALAGGGVAGDELRALETLREQRGVPLVAWLLRDLHHAIRVLRRSPGFTLVAVLTLALGTGTNAAVYQLMDALLLRPLPVDQPQQLVVVDLADRSGWIGRRTTGLPSLSAPVFFELRLRTEGVVDVAAWANAGFRQPDPGAARLRALYVSGNFFEVLRVQAQRGRLIAASDDHDGCGVPGVVSDRFWRSRLGARQDVIGSTLDLNARRVEIVGVAPPGFDGLEVGRSFDVAVPLCAHDTLSAEGPWRRDPSTSWLTVVGRIAPGVSLAQVNAAFDVASPHVFDATLPLDYPAADAPRYRALKLRATAAATGVSTLRDRFADALLILLVATGLVLLIGCTNLANLMLARAAARERELAMRLALGASSGRIVQQLAVESAVLAAAGAGAGLVFATVMSRVALTFMGDNLMLDLRPDARLIAYMTAAAAATCLAFGLVPAWRASRTVALAALRSSGRAVAGAGGRARQALIVVQVALSLVLLFGALLFTGTLRNLMAVDPGFRTAGVAAVRVELPPGKRSSQQRRQQLDRLLDAVRTVPGVSAVAEVRHVPFGGTGSSLTVSSPGSGSPTRTSVRVNAVSEGFLSAMNIAVIDGRDFTAHDRSAAAKVVLVNETAVARLGLRPAVGGTIVLETGPGDRTEAFDIVGLVRDTKYFSLREEALPILFVPIGVMPDPRPIADFLLHSDQTFVELAAAVAVRVQGIEPDAAATVQVLDDTIRNGLRRERLLAGLSVFFGLLSAFVAVVGLYGVLSYLVTQRTREIGVRLALGAGRPQILMMVLAEAAVVVAGGLLLGAVLALAGAGAVRALVFGVQPASLPAVASAGALLGAAALAACLIPAWRAARMEPTSALRLPS